MKTVLISGGSDGLGKALAKKLAAKYTVIILGNNTEKTKRVSKEIGCDFVLADVSNYSDVEAAVSKTVRKYSHIDYLVNNAGLWIEGPLERNDPKQIKKVIEVNTVGTIFLTHATLPYMKKKKRGRIINVISQAGLSAKAERVVYNTSKWAITGFTKSLALELMSHNITVVGFYPGSMKTSFFDKAGIKKGQSKYLELEDVIRALEFIIETKGDINIPELGIKPAWY